MIRHAAVIAIALAGCRGRAAGADDAGADDAGVDAGGSMACDAGAACYSDTCPFDEDAGSAALACDGSLPSCAIEGFELGCDCACVNGSWACTVEVDTVAECPFTCGPAPVSGAACECDGRGNWTCGDCTFAGSAGTCADPGSTCGFDACECTCSADQTWTCTGGSACPQ